MFNATLDYDVAGVTFASARDWLAGKIYATKTSDLDTTRPEIVFINEIGHRDAIPGALATIVALAQRGAKGAIAHTADPVMLNHLLGIGFVVAFNEKIDWRGMTVPAQRLVCSPEVFQAWLNKPASQALAKNMVPSII